MRRVRFEQILTQLKYTDEDPPHYVDRFFHVRKLAEACNSNMSTNFIPGWISCLDESMMIWTNKFGPGWVVLPRKPHPFGNEWHTIYCAMSVVVFLLSLWRGRIDQRREGSRSSRRTMEKLGADDADDKATVWNR